jgi:antirestriction protein ArdC
MSGGYGTKKYAFEELIAEMNAAFCCASLGIVPTVRHADYLGSWLDVLREDNRAIIRAASQASKAADYILGFLRKEEKPDAFSAGRALASCS